MLFFKSSKRLEPYAYSAISGLVGLVAVPIYGNTLGAEAFAVVGAIYIIQNFISLFENATGPRIIRIVAEKPKEMKLEAIEKLTTRSLRISIFITISFFITSLTLSTLFMINLLEVSGIYLFVASFIIGFKFIEVTNRSILVGLGDATDLLKARMVIQVTRHSMGVLAIFFLSYNVHYLIMAGALALASGVFIQNLMIKNNDYRYLQGIQKKETKQISTSLFVITLLNYLITSVDKFVFASYIGAQHLGYIFVSLSLLSVLNVIFGPTLLGQMTKYMDQSFSFTKKFKLLLSSLLIFPVLAFYGSEIISKFVFGTVDATFTHCLFLMTIGTVLNVISWFPYNLLIMRGKEKEALFVQFFGFLTQVFAWILMIGNTIHIIEWGWVIANLTLIILQISVLNYQRK